MKDSPVHVPYGQPEQKIILSPVVWALLLFLLALAPRLPGLRLFLTTDEPYFVEQAAGVIVSFLRSDFQGTYWHFYPGVTISWLDGLGLASQWMLARLTGTSSQLFYSFIHDDILDLLVSVRLPYAFLTACGVSGFYLLARRLLGQWTALLGALFIAFDPFYLAHSRVAHGDAPVSVFMGLSALAFLVYLQEVSLASTHKTDSSEERIPARKRWWLILSAVMGSLAALTKAPGHFVALFVILVAAGDWLMRSWRVRHLDWRLAGRWLVDLTLWGGVFALLFVALWPAMWVSPVATVVRMFDETFGKVEEGHLVFFMGRPTLNPGPWFYPYVISFRLTPITLIGAILSGAFVLVRWIAHMRRGDEGSRLPSHYVVAGLLWFYVVTLLLFGNLSPKKQDRYLLPLLPFLDLLAAFAYVEIVQFAYRQTSALRAHAGLQQQDGSGASLRSAQVVFYVALPLVLLLIHTLPVVTNYPYYLAYFNPLMGGLPRAVETTLVGWGEGMERAAAYLNQRADADQLYVAAVPVQTFLPYFEGTGENLYTNDVALRADYVVLYVSQAQRLAPSPEIVRYLSELEPEHTVTVEGVPYARIYPGTKLITTQVPPDAIPANIGFGEQLRLVGYRVSNDQPISDLSVVFYWHALAPMITDYTVSVRVVAPDGTWLAQNDSWPANGLLPTSQWRPGDYVRDEHLLVLPPNGSPGQYALEIVVYDAATGVALNEPLTVAKLTVEGSPP